jgi:Tfp pilus assembly protein PilE
VPPVPEDGEGVRAERYRSEVPSICSAPARADHLAAAGRPPRSVAGFVLSELALVVAIVGALLLIIVVSVNGIHESNSVGKCQTELRALKAATEQYLAENNRYPISKQELFAKNLLEATDAPDYDLHSGGPAEQPTFPASSDCA